MNLPRSLQGRLLALVLGLVVAVWGLTAVLTWTDMRHELDELLDAHLAQAAALLVAQQAHEAGDDEEHADSPALHRYASKVAFQIFHEGQLQMHSANAPAVPMISSGEKFRSGFKTVVIDATPWRVFAAHGGARDVQVYVGEQMQSRSSIAWAALRSMLWPTALALPLLALAVWWAVFHGVAPIRKLGSTLAERLPHDLHPVVIPGAPTEMSPMLAALNGLFERISQMMESERRFTADAAHELRTPISAIRAQAQVALVETNDALRSHALRATLEGCDRASRLIEQLLTLSRLESGNAPPGTPVDLGTLVRTVVAELAPRAVQRQQTIELDAAASCKIRADPTLLAVLVRNLVDNAIRYSPANATVKVAVLKREGHSVLCVEDSGPGMSAEDMARAGERFFRVLGTGQDGSGLGWSIVRRIAAVHHAVVDIGKSPALGGLLVKIAWPVEA
ncbi:MAG: ATP-binding protein [Usitatibacteraceae bacterium]